MDLVGLGLHEHVTGSLDRLLPAGDAWHDVPPHVDLFRRMVAMGATGRAAGKGFYARDGDQRLAIDLETLEYRPAAKPRLDAVAAAREGGLPALVATPDRYGDYAKTVLTRVLDYAAAMVPEVTDRPALIDLAMERGFNWKRGPFGMIEQLGGPPAPAAVRRRRRGAAVRPQGPSGARVKPVSDALGRRRRRRLPRVSHQGQRHRRRRAGADRAHRRRRRRALPGAGDLQRGRLLLDRRQPRPSADAGERGRLGSGAPRSASVASAPSTASSSRRCR